MILFNNKVPSDVKYHAQSHKNVSYRFKRCSFASTDWARRFESCGLLGVDVCVRSIVALWRRCCLPGGVDEWALLANDPLRCSR